jgi:hypothetical protein
MRRSSSLQPRHLVGEGAFSALGAEARTDFESISVDLALSSTRALRAFGCFCFSWGELGCPAHRGTIRSCS